MIEVPEIEEWVREVVAQAAPYLELRSRVLERCVRTWTIPQASANDGARLDTHKLAEEILRAATREGKNQNAPEVGFLVLALRAAGDSQWVNSLSFDVPGKGARAPGQAGELESPSIVGLIGQSMRQNENMHRMWLGSSESREASYERQLQAKDAVIAKMQEKIDDFAKKQMDLVLLAEELAKDDLERDATRRRLRLEERRHEYIEQKLENVLPILMNRLTGGGPGKGMPVAGQTALLQLFRSFKPGQLDGVMAGGRFTEDQAALLGEIYLSYESVSRADDEQKRAHAERDGVANGVGGPAKEGATS